MRRSRAAGLDGSRCSGHGIHCCSPLRDTPLHFHVAKDRGRRFLVAKGLGLTAACLVAGFVGFIAIEAFDVDVALWPIGAEDFTCEVNASSPPGVEPLLGCVALTAIPDNVIPAGAHLIAHHWARSALPTDDPSIPPPLNMAECREACLAAAPVLGHYSYTGPGDGRNVAGRARCSHLVSFSRALPLASRFLS